MTVLLPLETEFPGETPFLFPATLLAADRVVEFLMPIPNAEHAIVDIRKLRYYCLDPLHEEGKHKAHLFVITLGMTADDADALRAILLHAVKLYDAKLGRRDAYGQRYTLDFPAEWQGRRTMLRSGWIIEHGTDIPRLITCYPL